MDADEPELRRWRLMSELGARLTEQANDHVAFARVAAETIGRELRDGAAVVLLGLGPEPIMQVWHPDPARVRLVQDLLDSMKEHADRWVGEFSGRDERVVRRPPTAEQREYLRALRRYVTDYLDDGVVAPLRESSARARGLIIVARDHGSPPLDAVDMRALESAADTLSLVLELGLARAGQAAANRRWETAFESAAIGRAILAAGGTVQRVNSAACAILGRSAAELDGMGWQDLVDEQTLLAFGDLRDLLDEARARSSAGTIACVRRPDGTIRWTFVTVTLVRTADGARDVWDLQFADVTEQHEAEARAEMFQSLAESSPDFIGIADVNGGVRFVNAAGRALVGMPADRDLSTTTMHDFYLADARPIDRPVEDWSQVREGLWEGLSVLRDWRGGEPIPVSVRTFTVRDRRSAHRPVAIATVQRDIRRNLAAQREIEQLAEQRRLLLAELLTAEQDERERIAQDVHDDAIQLLAAAQLRLQLLAAGLEPRGPQRTAADAVADLLASAQASLRQLLRDLEPTHQQGRLIEQALADAAEAFFAGTSTEVTVTGSLTDVPPEVVSVFYRAGREAVSNARRHAGASRVDIALAEDVELWRLRVSDNGVGIAEDLPVRAGHRGLRGMRSRVEAVGGTCRIARGSAGGTEVFLEIPRPAGRPD